mgnify:CR=1 FL=1
MGKISKIRVVLLSFILICMYAVPSMALTSYLVNLTGNTYVKSYHADNYFADTYTGTVSVRGADRFYDPRSLTTCWPGWTRITYDVQGNISQKQINSTGSSDKTTRTATITVEDKWNIGPKTNVYGNYGANFFSNDAPLSILINE